MSEADVALVRRAAERYPDLGELLAEDFEFRPILTGGDTVGGGMYRGREGWADYRDELADTWSTFAIELVDAHDLGAGVVAAEAVLKGEGRSSRAPVSMPVCIVFTVRDGLLARAMSYHSLADALAAADG
jgi:ketosteroid isomerase-like protein